MSAYRALLSPYELKHLRLRNRVVSTAHAPGYAEAGRPGERYQLYHEEKAKGGIGLTMFGGSSNVARDSGSIYGQIYVGDDGIIPHFKTFADRIHAHDTALMCQITHMGRRTSWDSGDWFATVGPSAIRDPAHHSMPREMTDSDFKRIREAFAAAADRCRRGGLDGIEVLATTHLLGQFLSPLSNARSDRYGGDVEGRSRFLIEVIDAIRDTVGADYIVGVRFAADESNEGGLPAEDGIAIAKRLGNHGGIDFLNVNGAYGGSTPGLAENIPGMAFKSAPFIELARRVKIASGLPTIQAARLSDPATANHAIESGSVDLAGLTRPHIADPHIVRKLERGEEHRIRACVGAGYCVDRVYGGRDTLCIQNVSTGREAMFPHSPGKSATHLQISVIGGGPAGLEAARVCAERGHRVTLYEATDRLGGQVLLAARAGWRKDMRGIVDWLAGELQQLRVDIRLNAYIDSPEALPDNPDAVILATGGLPFCELPGGGDNLVHTCWDVLAGHATPEGRVLVYDEVGDHASLSVSDMLSAGGCEVVHVTPDRMAGRAVGGVNYPVYLRNLHANGATVTPDHRLHSVEKDGNRLKIGLHNTYTRTVTTVAADAVVVDQGTRPDTELADAFRTASRNGGAVDPDCFAEGKPQPASDGEGFLFYEIGDAVAGRNIHAALFDARRIAGAL